MVQFFDPQLINGPFEDPGLYVDLVFQRRALLFDLGDLSALRPRKLMRLEHVFVSHRHMDHFIGFDQLLRCLLGRERTVGMWGGPGIIEAVEARTSAYVWNLIEGYDGNLVLCVGEVGQDGRIRMAQFSGARRFRRVDLASRECPDGILVADPGFNVRAAFLDHGIPTLAFSLEERAHINIWRQRVEAHGLVVGPWLRGFKDAVVRGESDATPIPVAWAADARSRPAALPLGELKSQIMKVTKGRKIVYVVDAAFTPANIAVIVGLARGADLLFIEAPFLDSESDRAAARQHLTARQAGTLARWAGVKQLRTFHYSPRYRDREASLEEEARAAFDDRQAAAQR